MSETVTLSELQIKRRELENELASLSQTEKMLENDLRALEGKIIEQLKEEIYKLKHDLFTQEQLAREMGYIKPGETVYKFAPK